MCQIQNDHNYSLNNLKEDLTFKNQETSEFILVTYTYIHWTFNNTKDTVLVEFHTTQKINVAILCCFRFVRSHTIARRIIKSRKQFYATRKLYSTKIITASKQCASSHFELGSVWLKSKRHQNNKVDSCCTWCLKNARLWR